MQRLAEFRIYYNHTIHPELLRMEKKRRNLLALLVGSVFLLTAIFLIEMYIDIPVLSLFMLAPIGFYIAYLVYRIQKFRSTFKPYVVNLILDFIDDGLNFGTLTYDHKGLIPKKKFIASRIFSTPAPEYRGEDLIEGKIGELDFKMCELSVKEFSRVRNRLNYVFKGVFLHATFKKPMRGTIIILPKEFKQYLSRSIKAYIRFGARMVEEGYLSDRFEAAFMAYATPDASTQSLLSEEMQEAITDYREQTGKEIYVSFINNEIYIGVTEPKDILEPYIFSSNVSFELVREFFEDLQLLVSIVQDFDANH